MNLRSQTTKLFRAFTGAAGKCGLVCSGRGHSFGSGKTAGPRSKVIAACLAVLSVCAAEAGAQTVYFTANGGEYDVIGSLAGDQVWPDVALSTNGGFVVWQDNATDGDGWGISARRLDSTLSGSSGSFRVNDDGAYDQQNAHVAMQADGGAVFVWESGERGHQHIFARYLSADNTWLKTGDVSVSSSKYVQTAPRVAVLAGGNVVVVWSSFNQAGSASMQDVYAKILSSSGGVVKGEFLVNQFTSFNQRSPVVAALNDGGFVIGWVSEQQRKVASVGGGAVSNALDSVVNASVDIYARVFNKNGAAQTGEFLVNTGPAVCANPSVAPDAEGGFMVAWSARDAVVVNNVWDICARPFSAAGVGGNVTLLNTHLVGSQYAPNIAALGADYLVTWTSLGQDGSREGVYGRFLHQDGAPTSEEFRVNTTTGSQQIQPSVASDGVNQFVAVWTSYTSGPNSFDLYAQRYVDANSVLQRMAAPFVSAPFVSSDDYQPQLEVSWAPLQGIDVAGYEVYVDDSGTPAVTTQSNVWLMTDADGLKADSVHTFRVAYVKGDRSRSPLSAATKGRTWSGAKWGGVPREWMISHYGNDASRWPAVGSKLGSGGPTLAQVFLSGGNPLDSSTWLTTKLTKTGQGKFLNWNTQRGFRYQVQSSTNLISWENVGTPRFAAGTNDSIFVGGGSTGYYRVVLMR
jgi:hypothetical protein